MSQNASIGGKGLNSHCTCMLRVLTEWTITREHFDKMDDYPANVRTYLDPRVDSKVCFTLTWVVMIVTPDDVFLPTGSLGLQRFLRS